MIEAAANPYRPLPFWLLLGTYLLPIVFVWLFLRRCYRPSLRRAAFTFAIPVTVFPLLGAMPV
ncbi:MAG: hypothetical protein ACREB7_08300 [Sphingopyxis sp.]|uniref:hypothetical protein n=1 Tax=Sphingopyxis sp. TaxID=1908224 RepID=UPI003D6CBE52